MANYAQHVSGLRTPQSEPARDDQVKNSAGGYVFAVDVWTQLDRFLIMGSEGGTYYASEKDLTKDNYNALKACLKANGLRTVERIIEISLAGRAPKNDSAIFSLAVASADPDAVVRKAAIDAIPRVCRTGTHLFQYVTAVKQFRGWGRYLRQGVARWYDDKQAGKLAYQLAKYGQRDGISHRDVLRLSHPTTHQALYRWVTTGKDGGGDRLVDRKGDQKKYSDPGRLPEFIEAFEELRSQGCSEKRTVDLVGKYGFTHEMLPSEMKGSLKVWEALLVRMPPTAMIRNLGKMTSIGLIKPMSEAVKVISSRLRDSDVLRQGRIHPIAVLAALKIYANGQGEKGKLIWSPDRSVLDALDDCFYLAFQTIEPTGKNILLAIDVSASMDYSVVNGMSFLSAREVAAAMTMATARTETNWHCIGFTGRGWSCPRTLKGGVEPLKISPRQRMDDVVRYMEGLPMGNTDCALPMMYALEQGIDVDAFHVYTDNDTWCGDIHPFEALCLYRRRMEKPGAKLISAAFSSTGYTIADPSDAGMMDVVGFDTAAPSIMADFVRS